MLDEVHACNLFRVGGWISAYNVYYLMVRELDHCFCACQIEFIQLRSIIYLSPALYAQACLYMILGYIRVLGNSSL